MDVSFYATLRQTAGQKTVELALPAGATVQQLLEAVIARFPSMRDELLDGNGRLRGHVHLFVNGRDAPFLDRGMETVLRADDQVDVFPAVAGG
ncbi:MAG: ubiquitin-like small modifier protein 1 [Planctomycetota bacterium]|jgi:molybdopterin synthase sulfur carrier subunit